jgi:hypothetical protein
MLAVFAIHTSAMQMRPLDNSLGRWMWTMLTGLIACTLAITFFAAALLYLETFRQDQAFYYSKVCLSCK